MNIFLPIFALIVVYQRFIKKFATAGLIAYTVYLAYLTVMIPLNVIGGAIGLDVRHEVDSLDLNSRVSVQMATTPRVDTKGSILIQGTINNNSTVDIRSINVACRIQADIFGRSEHINTVIEAKVKRNSTAIFTGVIENVPTNNRDGLPAGSKQEVLDYFCRFAHANPA